jgi:uncharacterized membrane protein YkgB
MVTRGLPRTRRGGKPGVVQDLGRLLLVVGVLVALVGVGLLLAPRVPWLGHLPGDLVFRRERVTIYVPIVTSLVVSLVLTLLLNLFFRR